MKKNLKIKKMMTMNKIMEEKKVQKEVTQTNLPLLEYHKKNLEEAVVVKLTNLKKKLKVTGAILALKGTGGTKIINLRLWLLHKEAMLNFTKSISNLMEIVSNSLII